MSKSSDALAAVAFGPNEAGAAPTSCWDDFRQLAPSVSCDADQDSFSRLLSPPVGLFHEIRNGRMVILLGAEDGTGALVMAAQMASPQAINFMARHGRGLICLALDDAGVRRLELPLMGQQNGTRADSAFTVSIEARDGITTGISAADRARTIATAIDSSKGPEAIATPGHIFPLLSHRGGLLGRAQITEAAVDLARLSGLSSSAVVCKILNESGDAASVDQLVQLAHEHGLKIGGIADLVSFRKSHDNWLSVRSQQSIQSAGGATWTVINFRNAVFESNFIVLVTGPIESPGTTPVSIRRLDLFADILGVRETEGQRSLHDDMERIERLGRGVIVIADTSVRELPKNVSNPPENMGDGMPEGAFHESTLDQVTYELGIKHYFFLK